MKIIYITSRLPYGTGEAFIIPEIEQLVRMGHDIVVVPLVGHGKVIHVDVKPILKYFKLKQNLAPSLLWTALSVGLRNILTCLSFLFLICRLKNPVRSIKNLAVFPKSLWIADVAQRWNADHIHAHWSATPSTVAMIASTISGLPWSFTAHRGDIVENDNLARKCSSAIFVRSISEKGFQLFEQLNINIDVNKKKIIHMGVNLPARNELNEKSSESTVIVCPANLLPVKGHRYLIDAVQILSESGLSFKVDFLGEGYLRTDLQERIHSAGLSNVIALPGAIPHSELLNRYRNGEVDIMVLPSIDLGKGHHEGIPVSLMEAMAHCIPVISTVTGGIPELLSDNAGVLVPPENSKALAKELQRLIENKKLQTALGDSGRRRIEQSFSSESITKELVQCFALQRRPPPQEENFARDVSAYY